MVEPLDHDECIWSRKAWDTLAELADAKSAIARVEGMAAPQQGGDHLIRASAIRAALRGDGPVP